MCTYNTALLCTHFCRSCQTHYLQDNNSVEYRCSLYVCTTFKAESALEKLYQTRKYSILNMIYSVSPEIILAVGPYNPLVTCLLLNLTTPTLLLVQEKVWSLDSKYQVLELRVMNFVPLRTSAVRSSTLEMESVLDLQVVILSSISVPPLLSKWVNFEDCKPHTNNHFSVAVFTGTGIVLMFYLLSVDDGVYTAWVFWSICHRRWSTLINTPMPRCSEHSNARFSERNICRMRENFSSPTFTSQTQ